MSINLQGRIVSFHPRRSHSLEQAVVLAELFPKRFRHVTSIYFPPRLLRILRKIAPGRFSGLAKRSHGKLPWKYVILLPFTELKRVWWEKRRKVLHLDDYIRLNEYWQQKVLRRVTAPETSISFDGISNLLFRKWKNKSRLILDLSIGLPQYRLKVFHGDRFQPSMLDEVDDIQKKLFIQYQEEVELADLILCGSEFVKQTVAYFFPEQIGKCRILPYGVNVGEFNFPHRIFVQKDVFKFAFIGRVSWRKGAGLLLDAWKQFIIENPTCELHFFGGVDIEIGTDGHPRNVFMHGWLGQPDLVENLKGMDALVFPTTFEGSAIAVYQAMAMKLPVITTVNSGTVLKHGESCEIVKVGDNEALIAAMEKFVNNIDYRERIAEKAYLLSKDYTWGHYKERLTEILKEID
jgi:glycosyltransferase involved in cell wall biosynthesis